MGMSTQDTVERVNIARKAMQAQEAQFRQALADGLPARAQYHAEQAAALGREVKKLIDRCPRFIHHQLN